MNELNLQITQDLKNHLNDLCGNSLPKDFNEAFDYGIFPTGKLFRANLVWRYFCDLNNLEISNLKTKDYPNIQKLSSAVEIHHAYTLIHDDLPCMDNDDYRRGKLSTHKQFNEWIALLVGDGLLNLSYELLSEIEHPNALKLIKIFSKLCGPSGLILGQYLDLKNDKDEFSFDNVLKIHQLKTSNLFISCLTGSSILSNKENTEIFEMGKQMGIIFQLIDDLTELSETEVSKHEMNINPWLNDFNSSSLILINMATNLKTSLEPYPFLNELISNYIDKIKNKLMLNIKIIEIHLNRNLNPVISRL